MSEFPEDDAVSPVYSDTDTFWIAWAHPDAAEGDAVSGRLIAVDVGAAAPAGTQVIEIPSTLGPDSSGGVFSFTRPDQGWPVGRYRVDVMRAGTSVGSVEFDITRR